MQKVKAELRSIKCYSKDKKLLLHCEEDKCDINTHIVVWLFNNNIGFSHHRAIFQQKTTSYLSNILIAIKAYC